MTAPDGAAGTAAGAPPRLHLFHRKPRPGANSIEMLYQSIAEALAGEFRITWVVNRNPTKGVLPRLRDALRARRRQGDVNHVTGDVHYLAWFLDRRRTVLTIHDFVTLEHRRGLRRWLLLALWYRLPVRRAAAVVVISGATRDQLHRHLRCDPAKVHLIHNPVSGLFRPGGRRFDEGCPRILHVGTGPNKNLERHAAALAGLRCRLVVLGRPSPGQRRHLDAAGLSWEAHEGLDREAVVRLYQGCDLLLFASTYEGFGMPIVEAQATGLPVVTSNRWSMPEVAGAGALLVDPESVEGIREAVTSIVRDPGLRDRLVRAGRENARRFDLARAARAYADLYRRLAGAPR